MGVAIPDGSSLLPHYRTGSGSDRTQRAHFVRPIRLSQARLCKSIAPRLHSKESYTKLSAVATAPGSVILAIGHELRDWCRHPIQYRERSDRMPALNNRKNS